MACTASADIRILELAFASSASTSAPFGSSSSSSCCTSRSAILTCKLRRQPPILCIADSPSPSPFTEKHSIKPSHGGGKLGLLANFDRVTDRPINAGIISSKSDESSSSSSKAVEHDIANCLPELRQLLTLLHKDQSKHAGLHTNKDGLGNVYLVGTGPGDPDLLTLKALRLMQTADLVLYDRLVSTEILDLVHAGAQLLYVGKTSGYHSRTQDEIHQLLLSFAEAGATVLRLKGGDPLVFGRGGEEMDFLQQQGIRVKVIPGITAASGIAAELGIPLTHRGAANSVRFLTGHSMKGGSDPLFVAEQAADPDSTLVVYMGLSTLPALAAKLIRSGLPADTPAVAVERGTTVFQRTVFAHLQDLPANVVAEQLVSPTLILIGRVVALSPYWPFSTGVAHEHHMPSLSSA